MILWHYIYIVFRVFPNMIIDNVFCSYILYNKSRTSEESQMPSILRLAVLEGSTCRKAKGAMAGIVRGTVFIWRFYLEDIQVPGIMRSTVLASSPISSLVIYFK